MNVNVFDTKISQQSLVFEHKKHTEFVIGVDFSLFQKRMVASTGYDGRCLVWNWD
jgi:peroxin-7